jgi:acyl-CoA reductase-like NAD-dependent aldehyde dehydrogenase
MSVTISTFQNFVGGKWVDAAEGGTAEIINPSTGETIGESRTGPRRTSTARSTLRRRRCRSGSRRRRASVPSAAQARGRARRER